MKVIKLKLNNRWYVVAQTLVTLIDEDGVKSVDIYLAQDIKMEEVKEESDTL